MEHGELNLLCLLAMSVSFPGLGRKVACVPTLRGLFYQPMGKVIYLVFPMFLWAIEVDLQNMKSHVAPKTLEML